jgi:hypothetical protein
VCYPYDTAMEWITFCYSLPSKEGSSPRVTLWRRLRRLGALSIAGGVQILPSNDECLESFQWLAQEIRTANGEAAVMRVTQLTGMTDQQLIARFCTARAEDYREVEVNILELKQTVEGENKPDLSDARDRLVKLRRQYVNIAQIDYFDCPEGKRVAALLETLEQVVVPGVPAAVTVSQVDITQYRGKSWVTRPHPFVDRLSCVWLVRKFIDPGANISYAGVPAPDEVAFDMDGGQFGHRGNLCTFETMKLAFALDDPALRAIAEIVHEIDLHDDRYAWPEIAGIETVLRGWAKAEYSDSEMEQKGIGLFEGLYMAFLQRH